MYFRMFKCWHQVPWNTMSLTHCLQSGYIQAAIVNANKQGSI